MESTFVRALKIWWSFAWRGMMLMLVVVLPLQALISGSVFPMMPKSGQKPETQALQHLNILMMIAWPIVMAAIIGGQVQAILWMLKARWWVVRLTLIEHADVLSEATIRSIAADT